MSQRQQRSSRGRRRNNNNNNEERQYATSFSGWEPTSMDDAHVLNRFATPPSPPPLKIIVNGQTIEIPRYNGVAWWFPKQTPHPLERVLYALFTIVNSIQTLSLFVWTGVLVYHLKLWVVLALVLSVPLGLNLEEKHGANYGTAHTSLNTLRLGVYIMKALLSYTTSEKEDNDEQQVVLPNRLVVAGCYCALVFALGHGLCTVEKYIFGRTWNAFLLAYAELAYWIYCGYTFFN